MHSMSLLSLWHMQSVLLAGRILQSFMCFARLSSQHGMFVIVSHAVHVQHVTALLLLQGCTTRVTHGSLQPGIELFDLLRTSMYNNLLNELSDVATSIMS